MSRCLGHRGGGERGDVVVGKTLLDILADGTIGRGAIVEVDPPKRELTKAEWATLNRFLADMGIILIIRGRKG